MTVKVPLPYVDNNGVQCHQWSERTLAVTARLVIIFDDQGGRETINIGDVVTTATSNGHLSLTLSNGAEYRFAVPTDSLGILEQDIRQLAVWQRSERSGGGVSAAAELEKLAALRDQGVIDASDWERAKDLYLGKSEDAQQRAARELRQIYELKRSGVLSDSEFNMKKWDILARAD